MLSQWKRRNKAELSTIRSDKDQGGEDKSVRLHGQESFKNRFLWEGTSRSNNVGIKPQDTEAWENSNRDK